jgi:integrase
MTFQREFRSKGSKDFEARRLGSSSTHGSGLNCCKRACRTAAHLECLRWSSRYARLPSKLQVVLSADEVVRFLQAIPSLKSRTALTTVYAAGLRASEVMM